VNEILANHSLNAKIQAARLSVIPERFKNCTFEFLCPKNQHQEQALLLMHNDPGGSWFITGAYGNGNKHLFYAQYREVVLAGGIRCHARTTREVIEELRRAELDEDYIWP
jgi:DNA replication protein DnaC